MATFSSQFSLFPRAARRNAVLLARWRSKVWSTLLDLGSTTLRRGPEIAFLLWTSVVLAFSLVVAAGFVV
jgi:hypothetical protein